jgi:streptogramin lyase
VNAQPRALEFDATGTLWVVNGGTEAVLRFDPGTGSYEEIPVGMYAHSLDIDPAGDIWVNDYFAPEERIARVAASDSAVTVLPVPPARRPASEGLPLPYGLQVDGVGRLYSTQLAANTLVRYDSRSGDGTLFEMPAPNSGPRRPGLDRHDGLWIPEFNTGYLARFDPEAERFERIRLGPSSLGLYDVEVNQANDDVWATGSLASTLIRYRPGDGSILSVPLPTEPAYTRHLAVDEASGDVWTAYSSLPAATPRVARLRFLD